VLQPPKRWTSALLQIFQKSRHAVACLVAQNQLGFLADPQGAQGEDPGLGLVAGSLGKNTLEGTRHCKWVFTRSGFDWKSQWVLGLCGAGQTSPSEDKTNRWSLKAIPHVADISQDFLASPYHLFKVSVSQHLTKSDDTVYLFTSNFWGAAVKFGAPEPCRLPSRDGAWWSLAQLAALARWPRWPQHPHFY